MTDFINGKIENMKPGIKNPNPYNIYLFTNKYPSIVRITRTTYITITIIFLVLLLITSPYIINPYLINFALNSGLNTVEGFGDVGTSGSEVDTDIAWAAEIFSICEEYLGIFKEELGIDIFAVSSEVNPL